MRTTHAHYAILGDGRLARHFARYLTLLELPWSGWARKSASDFNSHEIADAATRLRATLAPATHVLVLVSDDAIQPLIRQYPFLHTRTLIHCAGAISLPGVAGAHPLMTFSGQSWTLQQYRRVPFMVETGYRFGDLFPALDNPHYPIAPDRKALYHALCVMAGNFPQILWQAVGERFARDLGLPAQVLDAYLRQSLENHIADPSGALTGPLARGDERTIERNLAALDGDPLGALYRAFLEAHRGMDEGGAWREAAS